MYITECRVCQSPQLELAIDFGEQPWGSQFLLKDRLGTEETFPLQVLHCQSCGTAQLSYTVPKETMFSNHPYYSSDTEARRKHFERVAASVMWVYDVEHPRVLDIGSNDGEQLRAYVKLGAEVQGVESSLWQVCDAESTGVPTKHAFFDHKVAEGLGQFDIINASGLLSCASDTHSVLGGIRHCLKPDGIVVVQFVYARSMMRRLAWDQINHENLLYFNCTTLDRLLRAHGLCITHAVRSDIDGGSVVALIKNSDGFGIEDCPELLWQEAPLHANELFKWQRFGEDARADIKEDREYLSVLSGQGRVIYGLGASAKSSARLNGLQLPDGTISCVTTDNDLIAGKYTPGSHLPIVDESGVETPDYCYCLEWDRADEILKKAGGARNGKWGKAGRTKYVIPGVER